jgi:pyrroline-5-carboxylate reductase
MKLAFIGSGKMAEAIIHGLIQSKEVPSKHIFISDKDEQRRSSIAKKYGVIAVSSNAEAISKADAVILCVKPQVMAAVLAELKPAAKAGALFISIAAGITIKSLEKYLTKAAVIRCMPNNPALIGEGITLIAGGTNAKEKDLKIAEKIFMSVGDAERADEKLMNAVTGLSGSGPAFVYETLSAMIEGGIEAGLSKELSKKLAEKTMLGSIKTVIKTKKSPDELRDMVTSPGGTTLAGLRVMEEGKFKSVLAKAVVRAAGRAKEISEEFERSL